MQVIAVPVKALDRAKRRLSPLLTLPERTAVVLAMLDDVLDACLAQPAWEVWSVSPDETVLEVAAGRGARPVRDEGGSLLGAIRQIERDTAGRADALAVVLGDLPLLTAGDLAPCLGTRSAVAAAPARSDGGTNVLVRRPPSVIAPRFGTSSFARHRSAAGRAGATFEAISTHGLAFDLDRPGDVAHVLASGAACRTRSACLRMGLAERLPVTTRG